MTWYNNSAITGFLGAIAGTLITAAVSLFIWRKTHKVKRLTCLISIPQSLLSIEDKVRDRLEITFDKKPVETMYSFRVSIANTGNTAIEEQPIFISLAEGAEIIEYKTEALPQPGFGEIREIEKKGHELDLRVNLLNPKDYVGVEIISIGNSSNTVKVGLKSKDVEVSMLKLDELRKEVERIEKFPPLMLLKIVKFARIMRQVSLVRGLGGLNDKQLENP